MSNNAIKSKTILCIVGKSGSGKTSLALHLRNHIPLVSSRTTREIRLGEVDGEAPYHKFLTTDDYIKDVISSGKTDFGQLDRGDDRIIADTNFGNNTYWAKISDVLNFDSPVIGYIIDPQGVANLYKAIEKAGDLIVTHGWNSKQAPLLHKLSETKIKILYVSAVQAVQEKTAQERRDRDKDQELGWDLCEALADYEFTTPNLPDERQRNLIIGMEAKRLADKIILQM